MTSHPSARAIQCSGWPAGCSRKTRYVNMCNLPMGPVSWSIPAKLARARLSAADEYFTIHAKQALHDSDLTPESILHKMLSGNRNCLRILQQQLSRSLTMQQPDAAQSGRAKISSRSAHQAGAGRAGFKVLNSREHLQVRGYPLWRGPPTAGHERRHARADIARPSDMNTHWRILLNDGAPIRAATLQKQLLCA